MKRSFASVAYFRRSKPILVKTSRKRTSRDLMTVILAGRTLVADELGPDDPAQRPTELTIERASSCRSCTTGELVGTVSHKRSGARSSRLETFDSCSILTETRVSLRNAALFDELSARVRELGALNQLASRRHRARTRLEDRALGQAVSVTPNRRLAQSCCSTKRDVHLRIAASAGLSAEIVANTRVLVADDRGTRRLDPRTACAGGRSAWRAARTDDSRRAISTAIGGPCRLQGRVDRGHQPEPNGKSPDAVTSERLNEVDLVRGSTRRGRQECPALRRPRNDVPRRDLVTRGRGRREALVHVRSLDRGR